MQASSQIIVNPIERNPLTIYKYERVQCPRHLKYVRSQPCSIHKNGVHCNGMGHGIDAHHLMLQGGRGISFKESDEWTLSLCRFHHNQVSACGNERDFWLRWDMSYEEAEAKAIYNSLTSPSHVIVERMTINLKFSGYTEDEITGMRIPVWL